MQSIVNLKTSKFTISVEGNIGVGKSTFLNYFNNNVNNIVIPEPIEKWKNVGGCFNLLESIVHLIMYLNYILKLKNNFNFFVFF